MNKKLLAAILDDISMKIMYLAEVRHMDGNAEYEPNFVRDPKPNPEPLSKHRNQLEEMAKFCIKQCLAKSIVYPHEVGAWLDKNDWKASSVSQIANLRKYGIYSKGKGRGYGYDPNKATTKISLTD